eukprot:scaffold407874_cov23-Prasinocladus_malaysianus.AAC.1
MDEQKKLMGWAAAKFRRAIRQRPDFHRAAYNLGTVFYAHAAALGHHQVRSQIMHPVDKEQYFISLHQICLSKGKHEGRHEVRHASERMSIDV